MLNTFSVAKQFCISEDWWNQFVKLRTFTRILVFFIVRRLVLEIHKCFVKYTEFIYWVMTIGDIAFPGIRMFK